MQNLSEMKEDELWLLWSDSSDMAVRCMRELERRKKESDRPRLRVVRGGGLASGLKPVTSKH